MPQLHAIPFDLLSIVYYMTCLHLSKRKPGGPAMTVDRQSRRNTVGFLMYEVTRLLRREINRRVQRLGLTNAQWLTLMRLGLNEGINQAALAELLEVQPISLGRTLDRLVEAGLIERRPNPDDRRAFRLFLTDRAQPVLDDIYTIASEVREQALAGMPAEARVVVIEALTSMRDNLMGNGTAPVGDDRTVKVAAKDKEGALT
jgi:MarR family transcriptional regulator for hemolysin